MRRRAAPSFVATRPPRPQHTNTGRAVCTIEPVCAQAPLARCQECTARAATAQPAPHRHWLPPLRTCTCGRRCGRLPPAAARAPLPLVPSLPPTCDPPHVAPLPRSPHRPTVCMPPERRPHSCVHVRLALARASPAAACKRGACCEGAMRFPLVEVACGLSPVPLPLLAPPCRHDAHDLCNIFIDSCMQAAQRGGGGVGSGSVGGSSREGALHHTGRAPTTADPGPLHAHTGGACVGHIRLHAGG